ncbi:uncharacterized protein F5147DRAFT_841443 [Suillus discolor]|uniref:DUF6533 domain-containing protein n=1 Tax=Suillus discolor TaxID=1912936 RepID=A0A9P7ES97_9AGAM|nr:uncharacterized protein F5147DRAFT_841443 [Suillus discolor]KAG2087370.1 hypothetical protein F5147DRAFT_841443 [Suillus discolor]
MTYISNDPSWWPSMNSAMFINYWQIASGVVVVYDWVLTLGQEIELIWRQGYSLMTVLYLIVHTLYWNTEFCCLSFAKHVIGIADRYSNVTYYAINGTNVASTAVLGVIMIARLHAMYQGSRTMLMFLVIIFLAVNIACGVIMAIALNDTVGEEFILSGIHMCGYAYGGSVELLLSMVWTLNTVWEVLALCLSVWIAVKHFRELRRLSLSTGSTIKDCFRVLIQSHVLYFASFVGVSSLQLAERSPAIANSSSIGVSILGGTLRVLSVVQMFVLGPRLILGVREFNAKLVASSDAGTTMDLIVFQEHVHVSTSSTV